MGSFFYRTYEALGLWLVASLRCACAVSRRFGLRTFHVRSVECVGIGKRLQGFGQAATMAPLCTLAVL